MKKLFLSLSLGGITTLVICQSSFFGVVSCIMYFVISSLGLSGDRFAFTLQKKVDLLTGSLLFVIPAIIFLDTVHEPQFLGFILQVSIIIETVVIVFIAYAMGLPKK